MPASINYVIGLNAGPLAAGFRLAHNAISGFKGTMSGLFVQLSGGMAAIGGLGGLIQKAFGSAAEMESAEQAFTTLVGSASKAKNLLGELKDFANTTPFEFPEVAQSAKVLLAFGSAAGEVKQELGQLGDIAAITGKPINELALIFGKVRSNVTLQMDEINQLSEAGIPIIKELANQFGVGTDQVRKLVENGKAGFENLQLALKNLTTGSGRFAGGMAKQAETVAGKWSTLTDAITEVLREFAKPILGELKRGLTWATDAAGRLVEKAREWGKAVATAIGVVRNLIANGQLWTVVVGWLKIALGEAVNYFVKAMAGAIGALAGLLYGAVKGAIEAALSLGEFGGIQTAIEEMKSGFKEAFDLTPDVINTASAKMQVGMALAMAKGMTQTEQIKDWGKGLVDGFWEAFKHTPPPDDALPVAGAPLKEPKRADKDRLAQIGLFIGGGGPAGERHARDTARNTAEANRHLKIIATNTGRKGSNVFTD